MTAKGLRYVVRRLALAIPTILTIVVLNFGLVHLAPGDAADVLAGEAGSATPQYMAQLRQTFGLDQPLYVQLVVYLERVLTLDLGYSFRHGMSVSALIATRLGPTLLLMLTVLLLSVGLGVLLGAIAARNLNRWRDNLISVLAVLAYATPVFWAGLMLIVVFSGRWSSKPSSPGRASAFSPTNRCSRATSICCWAFSSFPGAWSSWSTWQSICCTRCSTRASSCARALCANSPAASPATAPPWRA